MKNFICDHPLISLIMVGTVCKTVIEVTKIIKGDAKSVTVHGFIFPKKADEKTEVEDKVDENKEDQKEEIAKED